MNRKDFEDADKVLSDLDRAIKETKELNEYQNKVEYGVYKDPDRAVPIVVEVYPNKYNEYDSDRFLFHGYESRDEAEKRLGMFLNTVNKLKYWRMKDDER